MISYCHREQTITIIPVIQKSLIYLIINPKLCFTDNELLVSFNHIIIQKIHTHGYLMIKWRTIFMDIIIIIIYRYITSCIDIMNICDIRLFFCIE